MTNVKGKILNLNVINSELSHKGNALFDIRKNLLM